MHVSSNPKYWDAVNVKFYKKYSKLDEQHKKWADIVINGKKIYGPLGRSWDIKMTRDFRGELKIPWTIFSNLPVQGTAADVMMLARISFAKRIKDIECKLISTVHDSIVVDSPTENLQQLTDIAYQVFDDLPLNIKKIFGYDWVVPMTCEAKFGPNMKDTQKLARSA